MPPKSNAVAKGPTTDPLSANQTIVPKSPTIVYQGKRVLYNFPGDEALYGAVITYLDKVENVQLTHWSNTSAAAQSKSTSYQTGLKTTVGSEVSVNVGLSATFEDIGISVGATTKVLTSQETTTTKTETITVNIPAKSDMWVYQRKYVFRTEVTFVLDAWGQLWNVGSNGAYHIQKATATSEVMADDYVTSAKPLQSQATIDFKGKTPQNITASTTRKFENTTDRCKNTLKKLGINGSQQ